ncbi:probable protein phosphatase 2C 11, partial [Tanacetum coccineum]
PPISLLPPFMVGGAVDWCVMMSSLDASLSVVCSHAGCILFFSISSLSEPHTVRSNAANVEGMPDVAFLLILLANLQLWFNLQHDLLMRISSLPPFMPPISSLPPFMVGGVVDWYVMMSSLDASLSVVCSHAGRILFFSISSLSEPHTVRSNAANVWLLEQQVFCTFLSPRGSFLIGSKSTRFNYGYASFKGKRASMEDYFETTISEVDGRMVAFFGVFDGHGGSRTAEYLKNNLFKNLSGHPGFIKHTKNDIESDISTGIGVESKDGTAGQSRDQPLVAWIYGTTGGADALSQETDALCQLL